MESVVYKMGNKSMRIRYTIVTIRKWDSKWRYNDDVKIIAP